VLRLPNGTATGAAMVWQQAREVAGLVAVVLGVVVAMPGALRLGIWIAGMG